jgi:hypothetical protein
MRTVGLHIADSDDPSKCRFHSAIAREAAYSGLLQPLTTASRRSADPTSQIAVADVASAARRIVREIEGPNPQCATRRTLGRPRACQQVVLVHHVVEVIWGGERLELGPEMFELLRIRGQAFDQLLYRADRTLHEQAKVGDA